MPLLTTLAELRERVRRSADMENQNGVVSDSELNEYINESIRELYDLILDHEGGEIFCKNHPIMPKVGPYAYKLQDDFYKVTSVHYYINGGYVPGYPASPRDYALLAANPPSPELPRYYIRFNPATGDKYIYVFPAVDPDNLALTYIPHCPTLDFDTAAWDGFNGWEEYAIVSAAIKCLEKQEQDTAAFQLRLDRLKKRIQSHSAYVDTGIPRVIVRERHPGSRSTYVRRR